MCQLIMPMKYQMRIQPAKFEGLYPVYEPFFKSVKGIGGVINDNIIDFPETVGIDVVCELVKPYADHIQLSPIID